MSATTPIRPDDEPVDEETMAILDERLKTIDEDAKSARPWREVMTEIRAKLKHPALPRVICGSARSGSMN